MTCSVHLHCGCFVYNCLLEVHLHPGAHCTIPWLLIVDSRCVYPYTSLNTLGYSLWTPVLAPRSSLSRPTKWLVHCLSPRPLLATTIIHIRVGGEQLGHGWMWGIGDGIVHCALDIAKEVLDGMPMGYTRV